MLTLQMMIFTGKAKYLLTVFTTVVMVPLMLLAMLPSLAFADDTDDVLLTDEELVDSTKAFIVLAPYLQWSNINEEDMPALYSLLPNSDLANVVARSQLRDSDYLQDHAVTPVESALSFAQGRWETENAEISTRALKGEQEQVYYTQSGEALSLRFGSVLDDSGVFTAALGNSDVDGFKSRPAAIMLADNEGLVDYGNTATSATAETIGGVFALIKEGRNSFRSGIPIENAVIAIDSGDISHLDSIVSHVESKMDDGDIMIVTSSLSSASLPNKTDDGYCPLIVYENPTTSSEEAAQNFASPSLLTSESTRRQGILLELDLPVTVLSLLQNREVIRNDFFGFPATEYEGFGKVSASERVNYLSKQATLGKSIESSQDTMMLIYFAVLIIAFLCTFLMCSLQLKLKPGALEFMIPITRILWIISACFPISTVLMIPFVPANTDVLATCLTCLMVTLALSFVALLIGFFGRWLYSLAFIMLLTVITILLNILLGGPLTEVGFFNYDAIDAVRLYGMGNESAAMLFASWIVASGLLLNRFNEGKFAEAFKKWIFLFVSILLIIISVLPMFGANFGVLIWGIVGIFITWWMFNGRAHTIRGVLLLILGCAILAFLVLLLDSALSSSSHLANITYELNNSGIGAIPIILSNLLSFGFATVVYNPAASIIFAGIWIYLIWLRIAHPGPYYEFWNRNSYFNAAFAATLTISLLMLVVEDSGIALPALVLLYSTAGLTWLICDLHRWELRVFLEKDSSEEEEQKNEGVAKRLRHGFKLRR